MDDTFDALSLAHAVAVRTADGDDEVGEHVETIVSDDGVNDFRFVSLKRGYEGWQWSVTLYHDEEADAWTVNESSLIPTDEALRPPAWIPWKDRLLPSDLSVTDALGTAEDDERLEPGLFPEADQGLGADSGHGDGQTGRSRPHVACLGWEVCGRCVSESDEV